MGNGKVICSRVVILPKQSKLMTTYTAHMHIHICKHTCTHAYNACIHTTSAHTHVHIHVCTHTSHNVHTHTHVHMYIYTHMHIIHACIHTHTHRHTCWKALRGLQSRQEGQETGVPRGGNHLVSSALPQLCPQAPPGGQHLHWSPGSLSGHLFQMFSRGCCSTSSPEDESVLLQSSEPVLTAPERERPLSMRRESSSPGSGLLPRPPWRVRVSSGPTQIALQEWGQELAQKCWDLMLLLLSDILSFVLQESGAFQPHPGEAQTHHPLGQLL